MQIEEYFDSRGHSFFGAWFEGLDTQTALKISTVLFRMKQGNNSNIKNLGNGIFERTLDHGPGYRIYFGMENKNTIILLYGGCKNGQQKDINKAKFLWKEYQRNKKI